MCVLEVKLAKGQVCLSLSQHSQEGREGKEDLLHIKSTLNILISNQLIIMADKDMHI